jgi:hypothetical protein
MANWAIVIGIDRYWTERACLKGAVRDALRMREWLLDRNGGSVPEDNLKLVLSPLRGREPAGLEADDASNGNIIEGVADLLKQSQGKGERLYFFYAGHGLTARANQRDENALVASDFSEVLTINSLALRSLWEFLETTEFQDQFLFVDACRNIPWENVEFEVGRWPRPRRRDPGLPPTQQYILYATSPGLKARELREAGNERGAFTEALLDGLKGAGSAKAWSDARERYEVRWERLVDYVKTTLDERRLSVGGGLAQDVFQIPQDSGTRGVAGRQRNPVVAEFESDAFGAERLLVDLKPKKVVPVAEVTVFDELALPVESRKHLTGLPVEFSLPPRTYSLHATAPEYDRAVCRPPVELYGERLIPLELSRAAAAPADGNGEGATRALEEAAIASLVVWTSDPLAPVEIADATGHVIQAGNGTVTAEDVLAGFYRARLRTPEDEVVEELVELSPGMSRTVSLEAPAVEPSRAVRDVLEAIDADVHADNTLEVSEAAGRIASADLSTILALAGGIEVQGDPGYGYKLRQLGLKAFGEAIPAGAETGVYVLVGIETDGKQAARRYVKGLRLRVWPVGEPVPESSSRAVEAAKVAGVAEFAAATAAGPHWLALEPRGGKPIVFALALLPGRLAMLTLVVQPNLIRAFQYMPSLSPDDSAHPQALRRIELMQRVLLGGHLEAGYDVARELLHAKKVDPLAGCLGAYVFLRLGRASELARAVRNLTRFYPELSDSHVLMGEYAAARGNRTTAKKAFTKAIAAGLPIFGEGLTRLLEGLRAYKIEHPNERLVAQVFERHMSGSMWSAFTPESFKPGKVLLR